MLLTKAEKKLAWILIDKGISANLSHDPVPVPPTTLVQLRTSSFLPVSVKTYEGVLPMPRSDITPRVPVSTVQAGTVAQDTPTDEETQNNAVPGEVATTKE
ncbi:hypothetical protein pipiens_010010, partial [Culex pipiens pipiens]